MFEYRLLFCFSLISLVALVVAIRPLKNKKASYLIALFLLSIVVFSYFIWGGWSLERNYILRVAEQKRVDGLLRSVKSPQELINKLSSHLRKTPGSPKGWYLLGRLYKSQRQWDLSRESFAKAYKLKPENELFGVNYAQSLFEKHTLSSDKEARRILKKILNKNPNQPDTLAMLAMDAEAAHDYETSIKYWQRLLALVPNESEEALVIRKAIASAQEHLD